MPQLLLVDDDHDIRTLYYRALRSLGDVDEAPNGGEALKLLSAKRYDVILLDLHMPVVDGFAILQVLASKPGPNRDSSVFVISADTSEESRIKALRRHAVFFLSKPVHLATLISLVDGALKKQVAQAAKKKGPA